MSFCAVIEKIVKSNSRYISLDKAATIASIVCWNQLAISKPTEFHSFHCAEELQMAGEFIMPLLYDIETWKSFVPNIMSEDCCISKEKAHLKPKCLASIEGEKKYLTYLLQALGTINQPIYRNVERNEMENYYQTHLIVSSFKGKKTHVYLHIDFSIIWCHIEWWNMVENRRAN